MSGAEDENHKKNLAKRTGRRSERLVGAGGRVGAGARAFGGQRKVMGKIREMLGVFGSGSEISGNLWTLQKVGKQPRY